MYDYHSLAGSPGHLMMHILNKENSKKKSSFDVILEKDGLAIEPIKELR